MYVEEKNYLLALNGLKKFVAISKEKKRFSMMDLKSFMEPIFWEAGYRESYAYRYDTQVNILIVVTGGVGDIIISSATIRETRRLYPNAYITLCVPQYCLVVVENCPYVNEIVGISEFVDFNHAMSRLVSQMKVAITLLRRRYHLAFALCNNNESVAELTCYMSGAEIIKSNIYAERGRMHQVDVDLSVLESITSTPVSNRKMEVWTSDNSMTYASKLIKTIGGQKYCAVCIGGAQKKKQYPPQQYAKLLRRILTEESIIFFILGGKDEKHQSNIIKEDLKEHAVDLTGTTLDEAAAILKYCDYCITNDTSSLHIASALGVPILQIHCFPVDLNPYSYNILDVFYPYNQLAPSVTIQPEHVLPECSYSKDAYGCIADRPHCIATITPEKAFEAFKVLKQRIKDGLLEPFYFTKVQETDYSTQLEDILEYAESHGSWSKQLLARNADIVCGYGTGAYFYDSIQQWDLIGEFNINCVCDANEENGRKAAEKTNLRYLSFSDLLSLSRSKKVLVILFVGKMYPLYDQLKQHGLQVVTPWECILEMICPLPQNISWFKESRDAVMETFHMLEDRTSREIFVNVLGQHIAPSLAKISYRDMASIDKYFYVDFFEIGSEEVYCDCGAYDGGTVGQFLSVTNGKCKHMYIYEMVDENCKLIEERMKQEEEKYESLDSESYDLFHAAVWDEHCEIRFGKESKGPMDSYSVLKKDNAMPVQGVTIDETAELPITFMKIHVEGAELRALKGAERQIKKNHPKLAIVIDYRLSDIWEIPQYLKSLVPEYRFHIAHHGWHLDETVLYAFSANNL